MHDSFAMHVLQSAGDLVDISPNLLLWKADFIFTGSLHYHLEVAFLGPLYGNEKLVQLVVDEPAQILHDIRMI